MDRSIAVIAAALLLLLAAACAAGSAPRTLGDKVAALARQGVKDVRSVIDPQDGTGVRWPELIPDREPDFEWKAVTVTTKSLDKVWEQRIRQVLQDVLGKDTVLGCKPAALHCTVEYPSGASADLTVVERKGKLYLKQLTGAPPE